MQAKDVRTVSDLYPREWLHAEDLGVKAWVLEVVAVDVRELRQASGPGPAVVLSFKGANRRLILNKTQCRAMAELTGSERLDDWIGARVVLRAGMAPNGRPTVIVQGVDNG